MNKQLLYFSAVMLIFLFSCTTDDFDTKEKEKTVDFTIATSIPAEIRTYSSSNEGGVRNVDNTQFNLRYILEVWTKEPSRKLAWRDYKIVTENFETANVVFSASLLAQKYDFVFWADFVNKTATEENAANADLYYNTNNEENDGLQAIQMKEPYAAGETRDAFFAVVKDVDLAVSSHLDKVSLNRPFGKYRLIAADSPAADDPAYVTIDYQGNLPAGFNALTDEIIPGVIINAPSYRVDDVQHETVSIEGKSADAYILACDYIFTSDLTPTTIAFTANVYNSSGEVIGYRTISGFPVERNELTTVYGNFFY